MEHEELSQAKDDKLLQIGTRIEIKRTDGRVHSAFVAGLNFDLMCANVEWYESGEIKGKEIDLLSIQSLNPDIILQSNDPEPIEKNGTTTTNNNRKYKSGVAVSQPNTTRTNRPTTQNYMKASNSDLGLTPAQDEAHNRTSNVVKRVEKLKKNRDERRQKYADEKAEKYAISQLSIDNPHYALRNMILEYRKGLTIKPITAHEVVEDHLITVCVRKRPLNKMETAKNEVDVITVPSINQLIVHEPKNKIDLTKYMENQSFKFDYAFDESCTNEFIYRYTAQPLVKAIFQGGFATCFAYGQTGSGKTHTMGGKFVGRNQDCHQGIYAMATRDVFRYAQTTSKFTHLKPRVYASFFEIYSGKVFDLLANKMKLQVLEDGNQQVQIVGLTEKLVNSPEEVLQLIHRGNLARTFGQTAANAYSSRSHAVFQIILRAGVNSNKAHGKISLIDLAGNERGADTASTDRQTRMEGAEINKSLLALKECIRALGRKKSHLPFRMSKLTQVLKDSFIGPNSRTCMIAMVSPGVSCCEHSLNTLRYANRVKELVVGDIPLGKTGDVETKIKSGGLIKSSNMQEDLPLDMLHFHHIVSELQVAEEKMLENQKSITHQMSSAADKAKSLLGMSDLVDFNQEEYCIAWDALLTGTITSLSKAKEIVLDFRDKLAVEEKLSRKTKYK